MRTWDRTIVALSIVAIVVSACGSGEADNLDSPSEPTGSSTVTSQPAADQVTGGAAATTVAPDASKPSSTSTTTSPPQSAPPVTLQGPETTAEATPEDPVPVGEVLEIEGLWNIVVTAVDSDAAATVLAFTEINPEPEPGFQYVLVTIEGVYLGDRVAQPVFEWAISGGGASFEPFIPGCGVVPESIYDIIEVGPGEHFRANLCVPVTSDSVAAGLELFLLAPGDEARFFQLD